MPVLFQHHKHGSIGCSRRVVFSPANPSQWETLIGWEARAQMHGPPWQGPVAVGLVFGLPTPKRRRRALPSVRPDVNKLARAALDALTCVVFDDDRQLVRLTVEKRYSATPGVWVTVMSLNGNAPRCRYRADQGQGLGKGPGPGRRVGLKGWLLNVRFS